MRPKGSVSWDYFREKCVADYLDGWSDNYHGSCMAALNRFAEHYRAKKLSDVTPSRLSHFIKCMQRDGLAINTIRTHSDEALPIKAFRARNDVGDYQWRRLRKVLPLRAVGRSLYILGSDWLAYLESLEPD